MPYTFTITEVVNNIAVTTTASNIAVTIDNINFTVTSTNQTFKLTSNYNTVTIYENAVELKLSNLNTFWRGNWATNTSYYNGDFVDYLYSTYLLKDVYLASTTPYNSNTTPDQDSNWQRIQWHEAPFDYLTVTNNGSIGGRLTANTSVITNGLTATTVNATTAAVTNLSANNLSGSSGVLNINSGLIITGSTTITNSLSANSLSIGQGVSGASLVINGNALISGATTTTNLTVSGSSTFNGAATFNSNVNFATGSTLEVYNLHVNNDFGIGDLSFPSNNGSNLGDILYYDGTSRLLWGRVNDFIDWVLTDDLFTNEHGIYSNDKDNVSGDTFALKIGSGINGDRSWIEFKETYGNGTGQKGNIEIGGNVKFLNSTLTQVLSEVHLGGEFPQRRPDSNWLGFKTTQVGDLYVYGDIRQPSWASDHDTIADFWNVKARGSLQVNSYSVGGVPAGLRGTSAGGDAYGPVYAPDGFRFSDQSIQTTAYLGPASTSLVGGIQVGSNLNVTGAGVLSVSVATTGTRGVVIAGDGLSVEGDGTLNVSAASFSTAGIVQVGDYLNVDANSVISVNTASLAELFATAVIVTATNTTLGGIKVGSGFTVNPQTAVMNLNTATISRPGISQVGTYLQIDSNAILSVNTGTLLPYLSSQLTDFGVLG